eukprot:gene26716-biopygen17215
MSRGGCLRPESKLPIPISRGISIEKNIEK